MKTSRILLTFVVSVLLGVSMLQAADHWQVTVQGHTVREWYDRAMDKRQNKSEREYAFQVLGTAGDSGELALYEMLRASDEDPDPRFGFNVPKYWVRWKAVQTLGTMGPIARKAVPGLRWIVNNPNESVEVRQAADNAIRLLEAQPANELIGVWNETSYLPEFTLKFTGDGQVTWEGVIPGYGRKTLSGEYRIDSMGGIEIHVGETRMKGNVFNNVLTLTSSGKSWSLRRRGDFRR